MVVNPGQVRIVALLAAPLLGTGCAPSLELQVAPEVLSAEWSRPTAAGATAGAGIGHSLGQAMGSPQLQALLDEAALANPDIRIAAARIDQARALLRIARGAMLPTVSASAGLSGTRAGRNVDPFDFSEGFAGIDIAYDLDLFGGGAAERRAAQSRVRAAAFDREATRIVIDAEIARAFVQRAALADRIALLDRNIEQALELERIIRARLAAGDATRVDIGLQTIQVRQLQAERIRLAEAMDKARTALAVLVGQEAPRFVVTPAPLNSLAVPHLDPGKPADLLVRRPDIQAAEARIRAAGGDVAQARAAFLPQIRLSSSALVQAASLGGPLSTTLSIGAGLLAPIFDRGRLMGNFDLVTAQQRESVELYRRTLLTTLAEVEDAMSLADRSRAREELILQIVEEARLTARLARLRYIEGEADLRQVLDAEQLLVQAEDARAVALQQRLEAAIDLFKAIGGTPQAG